MVSGAPHSQRTARGPSAKQPITSERTLVAVVIVVVAVVIDLGVRNLDLAAAVALHRERGRARRERRQLLAALELVGGEDALGDVEGEEALEQVGALPGGREQLVGAPEAELVAREFGKRRVGRAELCVWACWGGVVCFFDGVGVKRQGEKREFKTGGKAIPDSKDASSRLTTVLPLSAGVRPSALMAARHVDRSAAVTHCPSAGAAKPEL